MKNMTKCTAIMASLLAISILAGCDNNSAPATDTTPVANIATDEPAYVPITEATTVTTTVVTTTEETTTEFTTTEDLVSVPVKSDFFDNISAKLHDTTGFKMVCNLKGTIPFSGNENGKLIKHSFTYVVTDRATYLESELADLNNPAENSKYEEYQKLEDDVVTTLTKYGDGWIDNTPKEMIRCDMSEKILSSVGLIGVLMNNDITTDEIFLEDDYIERDTNGNYIITLPEWYTLASTSSEFIGHGFSGLMRSPEIKDCLYDLSLTRPNGNIVYTFDKNFNLTKMVFDIIVPETGSYDLHGEISFEKWNEVPIINVPRVKELLNTTTISTDTPIESSTNDTTITTTIVPNE